LGSNIAKSVNIPVYSESNYQGGRFVPVAEKSSSNAGDIVKWVAPMYMDAQGNVRDELSGSCPASIPAALSSQEKVDMPKDCLSAMVVYSEGPYKARINIYDNLGKVVHSSTQSFGKCGELENKARAVGGRFESFLVWNQKEQSGNYVGSGVYIWKVIFETANGQQARLERQGIVRTIGTATCVLQ
jgi:hypothetical protein